MNVDQRVDQDGSLELQRHWKLFRQTGQSIESVDHDAVIRDWQRHTEPPSVATLALLTRRCHSTRFWLGSLFVSGR